jgi:hypothetical protein
VKQSVVESFVGAIALGWLFAQGVVHFAYVFSSPISAWIMRYEYGRFSGRLPISVSFLWKDAASELVRSFFLLLLWYILLRWLYFSPPEKETANPTQKSEELAS